MDRDEWVSTGEASHIMRVSPQWVRIMIRSGRLEAIPTLAGYVMRRSDVDALAAERAKRPPSTHRRPLLRDLVQA